MKLYIAGPMSGRPDFNYPAFFKAADDLRAAGFEVINPARAEGRENCREWLDIMRAALRDIAECDGMALLPGWDTSRGANIERDLGRSLRLPVWSIADWLEGADRSSQSPTSGGQA